MVLCLSCIDCDSDGTPVMPAIFRALSWWHLEHSTGRLAMSVVPWVRSCRVRMFDSTVPLSPTAATAPGAWHFWQFISSEVGITTLAVLPALSLTVATCNGFHTF